MSTYYDILGLNSGAGSMEIKAAFRRLAKLYHPDKNPAGKEHFEKILKAYEVLSDPVLRSNYDYRISYRHSASAAESATATGTKNWRFDEKEMKRRQYYNEHIKKYEKATSSYAPEPEQKKTYNEYKYMLFVTPVAAALFLLIMRLATPSGIKPYEPAEAAAAPAEAPVPQRRPVMKTGDAPYAGFFGSGGSDSTKAASLLVRNESGYDVAVCIFKRRRFLKSCFISNGGSCAMQHLPKGPWELRYSSGLSFDPEQAAANPRAKGRFTETPRFYKSSKPLADGELTLAKGATDNFERITEEEFFIKN